MRRAGCLALAFAVAAPALAHDRYEFDIGASVPDDTFVTYVELLHGQTQYHDLEATTPADQDWTFVQETLRHSYEVVVTNSPMRFASAPTSGFATMNRVDELGAILTAGAPAVIYDGAFAARWIAETAQPLGYSYVKVEGSRGWVPSRATRSRCGTRPTSCRVGTTRRRSSRCSRSRTPGTWW